MISVISEPLNGGFYLFGGEESRCVGHLSVRGGDFEMYHGDRGWFDLVNRAGPGMKV